jgi:catechol 2,3-dioxygenase-like lactoylglutathione lyase family enzyme
MIPRIASLTLEEPLDRTVFSLENRQQRAGTRRVHEAGQARARERLQASVADVVQEPTAQPHGVRDCAVRDPAGNLIRIQKLR